MERLGGGIWMHFYFSGIHLFSRKDSRVKQVFSSSFFPTNLLFCYIVRLISVFKMCSWEGGLSSESARNHSQTSSIFGRSESLSSISHREQHHLLSSWFPISDCPVCLKFGYVNSNEFVQAFKMHGLRRRGSDSWLTQEWLRKPDWVRSPDSLETPIFAECWLVNNDTIFQSD